MKVVSSREGIAVLLALVVVGLFANALTMWFMSSAQAQPPVLSVQDGQQTVTPLGAMSSAIDGAPIAFYALGNSQVCFIEAGGNPSVQCLSIDD